MISRRLELFLEKKIDFIKDVNLQDDGKGVYIRIWNLPDSQPELEDLPEYDEKEYFKKFPEKKSLEKKLLELEKRIEVLEGDGK